MLSEDASLFISVIAVAIAALALGWNIYRDIILKPKVRTKLGVSTLVTPGSSNQEEYVLLEPTNFGPGIVTIGSIVVKNTSFWKKLFKKEILAIIICDYENPLSAQLPAKIEVGSKISLLLRYDRECFLNQEWTHVGVYDYYGKFHSTPKKQIKEARELWLRDFGA